MPKARLTLGCYLFLALCLGTFAINYSAVAADRIRTPCNSDCRALACCPDDYCRKSMPLLPCRPCGQCDDYCRKKPPAIACFNDCGIDDYCRKPAPCACRPLNFNLFRCVPTLPMCSSSACELTHQRPTIPTPKPSSLSANPCSIR